MDAKRRGFFEGMKVDANLNITNLLFIDVILIFYNGCRREISFIQEFLDLFVTSTGMVINVTKSSIYLLNVNEEEFS